MNANVTDTFQADVERLREQAPGVFRNMLRQGEWGDLFYEHTASSLVTLRQQTGRGRIGPPVHTAKKGVRSGIGLRRMAGEQTFYAASEHADSSGLYALADDLRRVHRGSDIAHGSEPNGADRNSEPTDPTSYEMVRVAADAALSLEPSLQEVRVQLHQSMRRTLIVTSDGRCSTESRSHAVLRVAVRAGTGGTSAYALDGVAGAEIDLMACDPERVAAEAVQRARTLAEARSIQAGSMPIVIAGGWGGVWLHEAVGHFLEADVLAAHFPESPSARIGTTVASREVTLVDDPTLPGGRGSFTYDDEATPGQRTILVENGVVRNLLTDRRHALTHGLGATGNGRRQDYRYLPLPRMTNLVLQPGEADPESLIAAVQNGLYVSVVGSGVVHPEQDHFSFKVVEGYRLEKGRLTAPVTNVGISGSPSGILHQVAGIGTDLTFDHARGVCVKHGQAVPVSVGMPTVLLASLDIHPAK